MKWKAYLSLVKTAFSEFQRDNVIKLSASLAYYTMFSIGPLLLVTISLTGLFVKPETITGQIRLQLTQLLGSETTEQILTILTNLQTQNTAQNYSIVGIILLFLGATGVFADIQDSINYIWSIRAKPKRGWLKFFRNRMLSFSLIVSVGFLLIVSLVLNTLTDLLTSKLQHLFQDDFVVIFKVFNLVILFLVVSVLFAIIYSVLPDAKIKWKDAMVGATFTAFLFLVGKFFIGLYLSTANVGNAFGAGASVIIILSWVYYSSIILYFGAELTKAYAIQAGGGIIPHDTAVFIIKQEAKELSKSTNA
jgi:membrane protein